MARDPYGESDVARKFNQKKPKPNGVGQDGDPKVAAAMMRKFGMSNLANFYEDQGGQAESGKVPSMFGNMMDNKGNKLEDLNDRQWRFIKGLVIELIVEKYSGEDGLTYVGDSFKDYFWKKYNLTVELKSGLSGSMYGKKGNLNKCRTKSRKIEILKHKITLRDLFF